MDFNIQTKKISEMPSISVLDNTAVLQAVQGSTNYKILATDLDHIGMDVDGLGGNIDKLHFNTNTTTPISYDLYRNDAESILSIKLPDGGSYQFSAESSLTSEISIPSGQLDKSAIYVSMGTIAGTGIKIGTQMKFRIKRIAGTGTEPINNPFLGMVGIHYESDTIGSRTISSK